MWKLIREVLEEALDFGGWMELRALSDRIMNVREASERTRNRKE